ncbi:MAG: RdgB/HAM1 family non-canonical purine NTP pyrophosphatase [Bdellovibrionales bacterium]|nr:RdgB/HAM1 family non-canonical purine NTP pyrophosphatase [Bdellovibrionales bacterium]
MRTANVIVLASTNRHKFEEFRELIARHSGVELHPIEEHIRNADKLGYVETSDHYYDNAIAKARACNHGCHYPSLADDSGLEVDALGGKPGVHSHRFAIPKAGETQDSANVKKLLEAMKNVPEGQRTARFVCHLALVMEGKLVHVVGTLEGSIAREPQGTGGFGYDPIFIPKGQTQTLSELGNEIKNKISHRAQAVAHLMEEIKQQEIVLAKP